MIMKLRKRPGPAGSCRAIEEEEEEEEEDFYLMSGRLKVR
jgi:hypothetical protein